MKLITACVLSLQFSLLNAYVYPEERNDRRSDSYRHTRYISPVTYQAKATFSTRDHSAVRDNVIRNPAPVTYQTYDRRALETHQASSGVHSRPPRRHTDSRGYRSYPVASAYNQKSSYKPIYRTSYPQNDDHYRTYTLNDAKYDYHRGHDRRSSPKRTSHSSQDYHRRSFYGQPAPRRSYEYTARRPSRYYDPCLNLYDGQYVLNHDFKKLFPYVDNMCYFVKCANKKAYLNACGPATRNDKKGDGFCSHLDLEGYCGPSLHEYHQRKREKDEGKTGRYSRSYSSSPSHSSSRSYRPSSKSYQHYHK